MEKVKMAYQKTNKKYLGLVLLLQSLILILMTVYAISGTNRNSFSASAEQNSFIQDITEDAKVCMSLDPSERPVCAKMAGIKIAARTDKPGERLIECLKFRPYYVHDCQLGLSEGQ